MSQQVVVIGAGVIGLCAALYTARKGFRVTVIDRESAGHPGTSHGNAGMVVPSHCTPLAAPGMLPLALRWMLNPESPFSIKLRLSPELFGWCWRFWRASTARRVEQAAPVLRDLHLASRVAWNELAAEPDSGFELAEQGLLMLCKTRLALDHEAGHAELANRLGVSAQVLDARQTAALDPGVDLDILGSVYYPRDCHLSPERFLAALRRHLAATGIPILWQTAARGFRTDSARIRAVITDAGEIEADTVVLCGGTWSPQMGRELGLCLPMQAGKGYSLTLPQPRQLPRICSVLAEARVAVTPIHGTLRVGGTMEIAGLNQRIDPRRIQGIVKALPRYYPAFSARDFAGLEPWVGLRPVSPDGLPYLGRASRWSNLVVAAGHAMLGLSLAPVTGQVVAALVAREIPRFDLRLLHPDRYATAASAIHAR